MTYNDPLPPRDRSLRIWPVDTVAAPAKPDGPIAVLRAALGIARRYRFRLILWTLACVAAAGLYARTIPPTFTAAATLLLEPRRQIVTSARETAATPVLDLSRVDSELQVMRSERLLAAVFDGLNLQAVPELQPREPGPLARARDAVSRLLRADPESSPAGRPGRSADEARRQTAFDNFSGRLAGRRVGQSYVVEIAYSSSDPLLPARVANAAASAYVLQSVAFKADAARSGAEFLQARLDALDAQVAAAADGLRKGALPSRPTPDADARIVGAAQDPLVRSGPKTALIVGFGGVLALLSGFFVVVLASALDRKVRTGSGLSDAVGLPCVVAVPKLTGRFRGWTLSDEQRGGLAVSRPASRFALAIRDLRTAFAVAGAATRGQRNLVAAVAAFDEDADAPLLAANLARLIAAGGKPVTLITTDARYLWGSDGDGPATSLADALAARAEPDSIVFPSCDGVDFLPIRSFNIESALFADLGDPAVARLVERARLRGDVVFALPPLATSTDAKLLAPLADSVVVAAAVGRTDLDDVGSAVVALSRAGAAVIGVVLTGVTGRSSARA